MLRKLALAAAVGVSALAAASSLAMADNVRVYFGVPHYTYQVGPDYEYRDGYGWYRAGYDADIAVDEPVIVVDPDDEDRLTCSEARDAVEDLGFDQVVRDDCSGSVYTFVGKRDGDVYTVQVDAITGEIVAG